LGISADTVIKELKKRKTDRLCEQECLESHHITISVEMDEMRGFYHGKKREIWLWRAIGHHGGAAVAFWFGTREHKNLDKLLELLKPLNIGRACADGNYAYYERFSPEVLTVTKKNTQKAKERQKENICLRVP
jgi:IS1 family transposase